MKIKTMLKFLLCFLIIGNSFCLGIANAAGPSAGAFFKAGSAAENIVDGELGAVLHIQSLIMLFGTLAAVIIVLIYGIQWVTATSAKRQELKAGLYPLVIGIILLVIGPRVTLSIYNSLTVDSTTLEADAKSVAGNIISVIQMVGYIVAVVMILWVGIQWLMGTPAKKQELKTRMINVVIGAILIAGGVTILDWIANSASTDMTVNAPTEEVSPVEIPEVVPGAVNPVNPNFFPAAI